MLLSLENGVSIETRSPDTHAETFTAYVVKNTRTLYEKVSMTETDARVIFEDQVRINAPQT
jgi:hypothetical protein